MRNPEAVQPLEYRELSRTPPDLDGAFYAASCFAGGAPKRSATIWVAIEGDEERYSVTDGERPAPLASGAKWHRTYRLTHFKSEGL